MSDVDIYIPSRGRANLIGKRTLRLFPTATVVVAESELADYQAVARKVVTHPDLPTIGAIRAFIMEQAERFPIAMCDDDATAFFYMDRRGSHRRSDPRYIQAVVNATAYCAEDAMAGMFGFARTINPAHRFAYLPFEFSSNCTGFVGYTRRQGCYRADLAVAEDKWAFLWCLREDGIVWQDRRFAFDFAFGSAGGVANQRTDERIARERAILRREFKAAVEVAPQKRSPNTIRTTPSRGHFAKLSSIDV